MTLGVFNMQQLLERLSQPLDDLEFSTSDAEAHAAKNRYDYNLPCEFQLVTTKIYFITCVWL